MCINIKWKRTEDKGNRFFLVVPRDRTGCSWHKLKHIKFHLNTRKHFFYCEGGQTLELVAQRSCVVSVCGDNSKPNWTLSWAACSG